MPGLRGPDLHRQILEFQPDIQVLFMSGYAEGLAEMQLPPGALFLQKPFLLAADQPASASIAHLKLGHFRLPHSFA